VKAMPIAFSLDIASLAPVAEACMVRIVKAVAVATNINAIEPYSGSRKRVTHESGTSVSTPLKPE
jgi:hypothetical protein